jgi:cytosine deaminase
MSNLDTLSRKWNTTRRPIARLATRWRDNPRDDVDRQLAGLAQRLFQFRPELEHDGAMCLALEQAFIAADRGCPAVGAVLFNANGELLQRGRARNLKPYFRSDLHAEMQLVTRFEDKHRFKDMSAVQAGMDGTTLFTSLEPCTMCMARLILSGVKNVFHGADELGGGQVHLQENLPEVWRNLIASNGKRFARANCSEELRDISWQAFLLTITNSGRTDLWPEAKVL